MSIKERTASLLKELIAIKSVSGSEAQLQNFLEERFRSLGLEVLRQPVGEGRDNLIYLSEGPYLISCHVDTVPPINMRNAFKPVEIEGRIYGRGASDVKGALASLITAVELFREKNPGRELPVSLALVVDEENNSALGSERVVEVLGEDKRCLVLEPTYGRFCTSQNGSLEFRLVVEGQSVHGAEFEKVENPVKVLFRAVEVIEEKLSRPVNILMVKGGSEHYAVPHRCEALLEVKLYRGEKWKDMDAKVKEALKSINSSCRIIYIFEDGEDFIDFRCESMLGVLLDSFRDATGREPVLGTMPSWTDGANYHRAGYECVVFGHGSLKDSHTDRESISLKELEEMVGFFLSLFERLG